MTPFGFGYSFTVLGRPAPPSEKMPVAGFNEISPGLLPHLKIPLKKGRYLSAPTCQARLGPWLLMRLSRGAIFRMKNPVGQRLLLRFMDIAEKQPRQIVGVVGDVKWYLADNEPEPMAFTSPIVQQGSDYRGGSIDVPSCADI